VCYRRGEDRRAQLFIDERRSGSPRRSVRFETAAQTENNGDGLIVRWNRDLIIEGTLILIFNDANAPRVYPHS